MADVTLKRTVDVHKGFFVWKFLLYVTRIFHNLSLKLSFAIFGLIKLAAVEVVGHIK
jgi:hypothetical protein